MRIACLLLLIGCAAEAPTPTPELVFSAIPDHDTRRLQERFDPLASHLSEALGVPVRFVPATDYTASVELFRNGDVQLAWFGGLTGVQARAAVPGAHAIAQGAEDAAYKSYFIAHVSTGLTPADTFPKGLERFAFTFGSPSSTSGRLMPEHFLREHTGKGPDALFTEGYSFSGAHDKTAKLVESGQVPVGALNYKTWDTMVAEGRVDPAKAQVVWTTPTYADYNFTAHPSLETTFGAGFTARLRGALLAIDDPALLGALQRSALITATDADYAAVEAVARDLDMVR